MTHDITHCQGRECPLRERCRRYFVHIYEIPAQIPYLPYTTEMYDHGNCPNFYEF